MKEIRKAWNEEVIKLLIQEDIAIQSLVKKYGTHRWTDISRQLGDEYALGYRSGKQCR
jgi:hypothetical protein